MGAIDKQTVYNNLTDSPRKYQTKKGWTFFLFVCCLTASAASFQFGYNIGSTNLPTPLIKAMYLKRYYPEAITNQTTNQPINVNNQNNQTISKPLQKENAFVDLLWTITTALFVVGGMIGAFTSKYVLDFFGRKRGILFHYIFTLIGSILTFIAPLINSPECVMLSRFFFGIQGGMACGLVPTYLSEISPSSLRGQTGVIHQLCLTIGILVAQTLGFRQFLGTDNLWHYLLAMPIVPAILGGLVMIFFVPESPRALLIDNDDEHEARKALIRLRKTKDISDEIEEMNRESRDSNSNEAISIIELFTIKELRWPLITGLIMQLAQQLCGINAIFFYSESIFRGASIQDEHIQYAVFLTGFINVLTTIVAVFLIDKLGRKPLLVYPMMVMILDFILLTVFLILKENSKNYSYLSIVCITVFIICFAIGLGPIPFVYVAECFRQDARSAALAICMFVNWTANLVLTLSFPYLASLLTDYVFLVFTAIVAFALILIFKKVPETKGRSVDEINACFQGRRYMSDRTNNLLMTNTAHA